VLTKTVFTEILKLVNLNVIARQGYFQEFEIGGYRQMFDGCKHAQSPILHVKNIKNRKNDFELGGVDSQLGVVSTFPMWCKNITVAWHTVRPCSTNIESSPV